ncbi:hypothetical protein [Streptomyces sp. NPDC001020]
MTKNVQIAAALVGGYVLGRTKKAKMAVGLGMFLAGKKLDLDPRRVGKLLANSPVLGGLNDQVRTELVQATRTAATDALTQRAAGLASSLARRTQALEDPTGVTDTVGGDEDDSRDDVDDDSGDEEQEERPARRKASGPRSEKSSGSGDGGRAPAKRTRSTAQGGAHRTAGTARKRTGAAKSAASKATGSRSGTARKRTAPARENGGDGNA